MKKKFAIALALLLTLIFVGAAFADGPVCPDGGGWTKIDSGDLDLYPVSGATEYCFKAGTERYRTPEEAEASGHDLSHWSYFIPEPEGEQCGICSRVPFTWVDWYDRDGGCDGDYNNKRVETYPDARCGDICEQTDALEPVVVEGRWSDYEWDAKRQLFFMKRVVVTTTTYVSSYDDEIICDVVTDEETQEETKEAPAPQYAISVECNDECVPVVSVRFAANAPGRYMVIEGQGSTHEIGDGGGSFLARPGSYTWIIYCGEKPIDRGGFRVPECDCPIEPSVGFQQGCVEGVPVIGINFIGEDGDTLSITGNGRDLSYDPGVRREEMRPFDSYAWVIYRGAQGMKRGKLLVEACPEDTPVPTATPVPDDPDPEPSPPEGLGGGGGDTIEIVVAGLGLLSLLSVGAGVRAWVRRRDA